MRELKLWFFRDLTDEQRLKLFSLFGLPVDEIGNVHGRQTIALDHIATRLVKLVQDQTPAPKPKLRVKLPKIGNELYEHYPAMSAQTHAALVKDYAREAVRATLADVTNHGSKSDLHPEYVTSEDGTDHGYKSTLHPGSVPPEGGR